MGKYLDSNGLLYLWQKITAKFVAQEGGKGLSTNDFTNDLLAKLNGIESGANKYTLPQATAEILGGVKIGAGLTINPETGVVSATGGGTADSVDWANVQSKPTTIEGYGISDAYTKKEIDEFLKGLELTWDKISGKPETFPPATHNHDTEYYKKAEVYSKTEMDGKISSVYKPAGSVTFAGLPATPAVAQSGFVYNVTDAFTTDARFVEGAGKSHPVGTNVVVVAVSESDTTVYKFDVLAGFVDLSGYLETDDVQNISNEEIDQILAS